MKFVPVIFEDKHGVQTFRNDLVDISFEFEGEPHTLRFYIEDSVAPQIPFKHINRMGSNGKVRFYVVDPLGDLWVEYNGGEMGPAPVLAFLTLLDNNGYQEEAKTIRSLLEKIREDYDVENKDQD